MAPANKTTILALLSLISSLAALWQQSAILLMVNGIQYHRRRQMLLNLIERPLERMVSSNNYTSLSDHLKLSSALFSLPSDILFVIVAINFVLSCSCALFGGFLSITMSITYARLRRVCVVGIVYSKEIHRYMRRSRNVLVSCEHLSKSSVSFHPRVNGA